MPLDLGERARRLFLTDTTLRDGQQGWRNLSVSESLKVYELLVELSNGEPVILTTELYLYTSKDRELVKAVKDLDASYPRPIGWIRATLEDLRLAIEAKLEETTILTSISEYHVRFKFGLDRDRVFEKYLAVIEAAMSHGITPRCTLEDVTRADFDGYVAPFVERLTRLSEKYNVPFKLKLPDTLGVGLPFPEVPVPRGVPALVRRVLGLGVSPDNVIFHGHNDFGLAVANSLAAWVYGANGVETTLAGIGERAGNTPMEPMLLHLAGFGRGLNLRMIHRVPALLKELGFRVPDHYPVIGSNAFRTKAGIHIDGLLKNLLVYLPFDPERVLGIRPGVDVTPYSGRAAVLFWLRTRLPQAADGLNKDSPEVHAIYGDIVRLFELTGRTEPLSEEEMWEIVRKRIPVRGP